MQGKIINGFELKSLLGRGGMAEVWYAENEIGKPAAVKILNEDLSHNAQTIDRFRNEAVVMVKLDHPNIRQVYGYGTINGRPCIVMEYLEGNDLKARMKQGQRFAQEELERWWNQLVSALNYTHAQGIVHRDIKPSNIFIDKKGEVKLLDFGIAKVRESVLMTQTGAMMGTLMYMSPEQVQDSKHIGPESDIYSLAVTFIHLLTGKAPYDSTTSNDYAIRKGIVEQELDLSALPPSWRGFLKPYLAKEPAKRPALRVFQATIDTSLDKDDGTICDGESVSKKVNEVHNPVPQSSKSDDNLTNKKGLWIALSAVAIVVVLLVLLLKPKEEVTVTVEPEICQSKNNSVNGHEYVDLGLPSGTFWATCNVGADEPEDFGNYYAWGETKMKTTYNWTTYKFANGNWDNLTKYCNDSGYGNNGFTDNLTTLQSCDDPATTNWGNNWHTPDKAQWDELRDNLTHDWTMQNGVSGVIFTAKNGQTLFLPAAGVRWDSDLVGAGSRGDYWSRSLDTLNFDHHHPYAAWHLYISSELWADGKRAFGVLEYHRDGGYSIRPVLGN